MVGAIWDREVTMAAGRPYLAESAWGTGTPSVPWSPGSFAPYAYWVFAEADPLHDWWGVIDAGYDMLFRVSSEAFTSAHSAGLPPNAVGIDRVTGAPSTLRMNGLDTSDYGDAAARVYWRVAVHNAWTADGRASTYLSLAGFLRDEAGRGLVRSSYAHDGSPRSERPSAIGSTAALSALLTLDRPLAESLFASQFLGGVTRSPDGVHWGDAHDLRTQEWMWAGAALRAGLITDEWHELSATVAGR
jgi:hypothetical protein